MNGDCQFQSADQERRSQQYRKCLRTLNCHLRLFGLVSLKKWVRRRKISFTFKLRKEATMELLVILVIVVILGGVTYKWGKRIGSRKGFGVGRARGRG
jgi:hypothetical protein